MKILSLKGFVAINILLCALILEAQTAQEDGVIATINSFFDAFHAQDSTTLHALVNEGVVMQTVARKEDGSLFVRTNTYADFVKAIISIPDSVDFREKLLDYKVQLDGPMASAWTPYEFWVNGKFSHCGVNSFQLFRDDEKWKIIYIIDTRRKEGCP